jgi:hypothetical protein
MAEHDEDQEFMDNMDEIEVLIQSQAEEIDRLVSNIPKSDRLQELIQWFEERGLNVNMDTTVRFAIEPVEDEEEPDTPQSFPVIENMISNN